MTPIKKHEKHTQNLQYCIDLQADIMKSGQGNCIRINIQQNIIKQ